jgi:hypothetical protein
VTPRREVLAFAEAMEEKLRENDHKGGRKQCSLSYLKERLREEADELSRVLSLRAGSGTAQHHEYSRAVRREAADIANIAMMIADVCGALLPAPVCGEGQEGKVQKSESVPAAGVPPVEPGMRPGQRCIWAIPHNADVLAHTFDAKADAAWKSSQFEPAKRCTYIQPAETGSAATVCAEDCVTCGHAESLHRPQIDGGSCGASTDDGRCDCRPQRQRLRICARTGCGAGAVRGSPSCQYHTDNPPTLNPRAATVCAEWCGTMQRSHGPVLPNEVHFQRTKGERCFCSEACRDAGKPLSPSTPAASSREG